VQNTAYHTAIRWTNHGLILAVNTCFLAISNRLEVINVFRLVGYGGYSISAAKRRHCTDVTSKFDHPTPTMDRWPGESFPPSLAVLKLHSFPYAGTGFNLVIPFMRMFGYFNTRMVPIPKFYLGPCVSGSDAQSDVLFDVIHQIFVRYRRKRLSWKFLFLSQKCNNGLGNFD
jgi:hypothetical protein